MKILLFLLLFLPSVRTQQMPQLLQDQITSFLLQLQDINCREGLLLIDKMQNTLFKLYILLVNYHNNSESKLLLDINIRVIELLTVVDEIVNFIAAKKIKNTDNILEGDHNIVKGKGNCVQGNQNVAVGIDNQVCGDRNKVKGKGNTVIGNNNSQIGDNNFSIGSNNQIKGKNNIVFSNKKQIKGDNQLQLSQYNLDIKKARSNQDPFC